MKESENTGSCSGPNGEHRARGYTGKDAAVSFEEELQWVRNDPSEAINWAQGNMNWEDLASVAFKISDPPPLDKDATWGQAPGRIREWPPGLKP